MLNTTSLATVQGWIDAAISANQTIFLLFHRIATPSDDYAYKWTIQEFTDLVAYIASKEIDVLTVDEFWTRYQRYS